MKSYFRTVFQSVIVQGKRETLVFAILFTVRLSALIVVSWIKELIKTRVCKTVCVLLWFCTLICKFEEIIMTGKCWLVCVEYFGKSKAPECLTSLKPECGMMEAPGTSPGVAGLTSSRPSLRQNIWTGPLCCLRYVLCFYGSFMVFSGMGQWIIFITVVSIIFNSLNINFGHSEAVFDSDLVNMLNIEKYFPKYKFR